MIQFIGGCLRFLTLVAICFLVGFFLGCAPPAEDSATSPTAPSYDASCVVKSSTMGCIDQATYDEVIRAKEEREDAGAPEEGDPPGLHGP